MKMMPARDASKPLKIIHDLDIVDSENFGIKWKGIEYPIHSLTVGQGMQMTLAYQKLVDVEMRLSQGERIEPLEVAQTYSNLFSIVMPGISAQDVLEMGQNRVNTVLSLISRILSGDPSLLDTVKKKPISLKLRSNGSQKLRSFLDFILSPIETS